jgi:hypothetical protein
MYISAQAGLATRSAESLAAVRRPSAAGIGANWQLAGRQAAALAVLGISDVLSARGTVSIAASPDSAAPAALRGLAADFRGALADARERHPGISSAHARHIAQAETIFANRGMFPPQGFHIHTDLGDGASITSHIPPVARVPEPAAVKFSQAASGLVAEMGGIRSAVSTAQLQALYAEWA